MTKQEKIDVMESFIEAIESLDRAMNTENDIGNLLTESYTLPDEFTDLGWCLKEWLWNAIEKYEEAEYLDTTYNKLVTEEQLKSEYEVLIATNRTNAKNFKEYKEGCLESGFLELIK